MMCFKCGQKFTRIRRKANSCPVCSSSLCSQCLCKQFREKHTGFCRCEKYCFNANLVLRPKHSDIDKIYASIKEKEKAFRNAAAATLRSVATLREYRETATRKIPKIILRIKLLKDYLKVYPQDIKTTLLLRQEQTLLGLFETIEVDSELTNCEFCDGGKITIHDQSLQHMCNMRILFSFENSIYPYHLPKIINKKLFNLPKRKCLQCKHVNKTLRSNNKRVVERRCGSCGFLIMFYKKHADINTICCPKCSMLTSRWGDIVLTDLLDVYKTFYNFSGRLVDGDIGEY